MSNEILINITSVETRVAIVEQGLVHEVHLERVSHQGLVGNIYYGKVQRVLPGMQAAFIDIGSERSAFMHAQYIVVLDEQGMEKRITPNQLSDNRQLVHQGQDRVVQVAKDAI